MLGTTLFVDAANFTTADQWIAEKLNAWTIDGFPIGNLILVFIALILTVLLSAAIGMEREMRGRSAGLRTHLLVAIGSAIVMIISIYGFPEIPAGWSRDPARLAAQVVAGIGFLGAGAIIHNNGGIKGLTTASTIWLAMAIGLACGSMNFILAAIGTIIVMVVLISFRKVEQRLTKNHPVVIVLADADKPVMTDLLGCAKKHDANIGDIVTQIINDGGAEKIQVTFRLSSSNGETLDQQAFISDLKKSIEAIDIQVLNHH